MPAPARRASRAGHGRGRAGRPQPWTRARKVALAPARVALREGTRDEARRPRHALRVEEDVGLERSMRVVVHVESLLAALRTRIEAGAELHHEHPVVRGRGEYAAGPGIEAEADREAQLDPRQADQVAGAWREAMIRLARREHELHRNAVSGHPSHDVVHGEDRRRHSPPRLSRLAFSPATGAERDEGEEGRRGWRRRSARAPRVCRQAARAQAAHRPYQTTSCESATKPRGGRPTAAGRQPATSNRRSQRRHRKWWWWSFPAGS